LRGVGAELDGGLVSGLSEVGEEVANLLLAGIDDLTGGRLEIGLRYGAGGEACSGERRAGRRLVLSDDVGHRDPFADFGSSLAGQSPMWLAVALIPFVTVGTVGFGATSMYSCGLDLDAIVPSFSRAGATALVCGGTIALVFVGAFVLDARDSIAAISLILVVLATPWAAITTAGFLRARGRYHLDDLQVFNEGRRGGAYWFTAGFNLRAIVAWVAGAGFGCLAIDSSLYTGPLASLAGGLRRPAESRRQHRCTAGDAGRRGSDRAPQAFGGARPRRARRARRPQDRIALRQSRYGHHEPAA
jgi:hypothetical protein